MSEAEDPRARFRELPEPVRLADVVETSQADLPRVVETQPDIDLRLAAGAGPV